MPVDSSTTFVSYGREDAEAFVLPLAEDLRKEGIRVWIDQLELEPGKPWDEEVEQALIACGRVMVILSPASVNSRNVRDEFSFAVQEEKPIIPILYRSCRVPMPLGRLERVDFTQDYSHGLNRLLRALGKWKIKTE